MSCPGGGDSRVGPGGVISDINRQNAAPIVSSFAPQSKSDLVVAVQEAERRGGGAKPSGSLYSLSAAAMPDFFQIETRENLNKHLSRPFPFGDRVLPTDRYRSATHNRINLHSVVRRDSPISEGSALIHVEASIQLRLLISDLTTMGLAIPTMGSGSTQTLAGAVSTGTHGADFVVPPLGDFIRAIHLVGPGGQEWWIERSTGITESALLSGLPDWCADTRIIKHDEMFHAALVGVGRFGVWYSVIIEAVAQYGLVRETVDEPWFAFRNRLSTSVESGYFAEGGLLAQPRDGQELRALEAIMNPNSGNARVTRRWLAPTVTSPTGEGASGGRSHFQALMCHSHMPLIPELLDVAAAAVNTIGSLKLLIPFAGPILAAPYFYAGARLHFLAIRIRIEHPNASEVIAELFDIFRTDHLSELRQHVTNIATSIFNGARPVGVTRGLSYEILDMSDPGDDADCAIVDSAEVFFNARSESLIPFLDNLVARLIPERPVEALFSLRFCGRSEALLAMEKHELNVAVEIAALRPNFRRFVETAVAEAVRLGATVHWGQQQFAYSPDDVAGLYGIDLTRWRRALAYIEDISPKDAFSSQYTRRRGLEWEGFIEPSSVPDYGVVTAREQQFVVAAHHPHR